MTQLSSDDLYQTRLENINDKSHSVVEIIHTSGFPKSMFNFVKILTSFYFKINLKACGLSKAIKGFRWTYLMSNHHKILVSEVTKNKSSNRRQNFTIILR